MYLCDLKPEGGPLGGASLHVNKCKLSGEVIVILIKYLLSILKLFITIINFQVMQKIKLGRGDLRKKFCE